MQLYRFTWTVTEYGFDIENGQRFLDAFTEARPEIGVSVSQNTAIGHLSVTFSVEGKDIYEAVEKAWDIFVAGAGGTGLRPTEVVDVAGSLATAEDVEKERELQPA